MRFAVFLTLITFAVALDIELLHNGIFPPGLASGANFGRSAAISGDLLVFGAPIDASNQGRAYAFRHTSNNSISSLEHEFDPSSVVSLTAGFGTAIVTTTVASVELIVISAPSDVDGGNTVGTVFVHANLAGTWTRVTTLRSPNAVHGGEFGATLAVVGARLYVGAPGEPTGGAVYPFTLDSTGAATPGSPIAPAAQSGMRFGASLAACGTRVLVGAPYCNTADVTNLGAIFLFDVADIDAPVLLGSTGGMIQLNNVRFGHDVALSDTLIVATSFAYGRTVSVFTDINAMPAVINNATDASFATSVHIDDGDTIWAYTPDPALTGRIDALTFSTVTHTWGVESTITSPDTTWQDEFGASMAIDGHRMVVGAPGHDDDGSDTGAAYLYWTGAPECPTPCGGNASCLIPFTCTCNAGFEGDGFDCIPVCSSCTPSTYGVCTAPDTCVDIIKSSLDSGLTLELTSGVTKQSLAANVSHAIDDSAVDSGVWTIVPIVSEASPTVRVSASVTGPRGSQAIYRDIDVSTMPAPAGVSEVKVNTTHAWVEEVARGGYCWATIELTGSIASSFAVSAIGFDMDIGLETAQTLCMGSTMVSPSNFIDNVEFTMTANTTVTTIGSPTMICLQPSIPLAIHSADSFMALVNQLPVDTVINDGRLCVVIDPIAPTPVSTKAVPALDAAGEVPNTNMYTVDWFIDSDLVWSGSVDLAPAPAPDDWTRYLPVIVAVALIVVCSGATVCCVGVCLVCFIALCGSTLPLSAVGLGARKMTRPAPTPEDPPTPDPGLGTMAYLTLKLGDASDVEGDSTDTQFSWSENETPTQSPRGRTLPDVSPKPAPPRLLPSITPKINLNLGDLGESSEIDSITTRSVRPPPRLAVSPVLLGDGGAQPSPVLGGLPSPSLNLSTPTIPTANPPPPRGTLPGRSLKLLPPGPLGKLAPGKLSPLAGARVLMPPVELSDRVRQCPAIQTALKK